MMCFLIINAHSRNNALFLKFIYKLNYISIMNKGIKHSLASIQQRQKSTAKTKVNCISSTAH